VPRNLSIPASARRANPYPNVDLGGDPRLVVTVRATQRVALNFNKPDQRFLDRVSGKPPTLFKDGRLEQNAALALADSLLRNKLKVARGSVKNCLKQ
jgi:hypothetical protein